MSLAQSVPSLLLFTVFAVNILRSVRSEEYIYEEIDEEALRGLKAAGARLVNARAAAPDTIEFVAAFYLSSDPVLRLPTCSAALITPNVALRFTAIILIVQN